MKLSPLLITELRSLFGLIRGLMIFWLIATPVLFFSSWRSAHHWTAGFGTIEFSPAPIKMRADPSPNAKVVEGIKLRTLSSELVVADQAEGTKLIEATRVPVFVARIARTLILFAIAHLLWRLCQSMERGEVFSPKNSALVRWLGLALTLRPVVVLIVETWKNACIARYVENHVTFEVLRPIVTSSGLGWWERTLENLMNFGSFDFSLFVTGLLVLAFAEVFRRGLILKQEADLTV